MTEEELEQEAEEYVDFHHYDEYVTDIAEVIQAYMDGAESREKRIAELEKENAKLKERVNEQSERIAELTQELDDNINRFG